jgi:hypothetical protein
VQCSALQKPRSGLALLHDNQCHCHCHYQLLVVVVEYVDSIIHTSD